MATKQATYETFYTKAPGSDKLRKTAESRLKFLVKDGWHEMERTQLSADAIRIRFEREVGTRPLPPLRKNVEPPPRREGGRGGFGGGGRGGPGGGPGGGRGGPGGGRGGPGGGRGGPVGGRGGPGGARGGPPTGGQPPQRG